MLEQNIDEENTIKSAAQNKYKDKIEKDYEAKIISLLEPVVGTGRVVAKVNVALDFVKKDVEEEIYSPEGSIRSQQVIENTNNTQGMLPNNGGVAGVDNNIQVPTTVGDGSKISSNSEGSNTVTNYEISRKIISQKDGNYTNIKELQLLLLLIRLS